jgi:predicted phosphoribosyltransferase
VEELRGEVDDLICLQTPKRFRAIGYFYEEFGQLSDEDVVRMMESVREHRVGQTPMHR